MANEEYPDQFSKEEVIRYNDLEFIDGPEFRGLLLSYTYIDVNKHCYQTRIDKLPIPKSTSSIYDLKVRIDEWAVVYQSNPCLKFNQKRELMAGHMAGGRIAYKAPNLIYLGNGEYHGDGIYHEDVGIQDNESEYGKIIEINLISGQSRIYSKGHRNPQGIAIDTEGRLWTSEHGMRGGDELNLILEGKNYGWPIENLGTLYSGIPAATDGRVGRHEIHEKPVYAWLPSAAVSSLTSINGFHDTWDGDLLIGSLTAKTLYRARIHEDRIVFLESIPIGERIRDVMQVGPKKLALWLEPEKVVILKAIERKDPLDGLISGLKEKGMSIKTAETVHSVITACSECHSLDESVHGAGPSLHNLMNRNIASTAFSGYTPALRQTSGSWDQKTLTEYLTNPESVAFGTSMTGLGVGDPDLAKAISTAFSILSDE